MVPDLTTGQFMKIIEEIPTLMKIKLQGMGEPFLNRELLDMAGIADKSGMKVVANSNATMFNDEMTAKIAAGGYHARPISSMAMKANGSKRGACDGLN